MNVCRRLTSLFVALAVAAAASAAYATEVDIDATSPSGSNLSLGAGTYNVSEIAGTYVSANLWADGGVGSSATGGPCDTPSSCRYGFRPTFDISINGGPETSYSLPVAQGAFPATYDTAADALAAFQTYQTTNPISFTLNSASTVNFLVPDANYIDNTGGVSLSVVSAAPEPAAWMLMILGIGGIGLMLRRAKSLQGPSLAETGAA